jgi:hypothetical protein
MLPRIFWLHMLDYSMAFGASWTSGYRTVAHNHLVGGVDGSPHTHGVGADVEYDSSRPGPEADAYLAQRGLRRLDEGTHDHIQPIGWENHP